MASNLSVVFKMRVESSYLIIGVRRCSGCDGHAQWLDDQFMGSRVDVDSSNDCWVCHVVNARGAQVVLLPPIMGVVIYV